MRASSKQFLAGVLSGSLVTMGLGLTLVYLLGGWLLLHMFLVGVRSYWALLFFFCPMVLAAAGLFLAVRSLRNAHTGSASRLVLGTILILVSLLPIAALPVSGVLLGSLGIDIHWNGSKLGGYVSLACTGLTLFCSFLAGLRLLKTTADN